MRRILISVAVATSLLTACQSSETDGTNSAASQAEAMVIAWEDLMPVGEEARLAEMYTNYYEELEGRMLEGQQRLLDAAGDGSGFGLSSIAEGSANDTMEQIGTFNVVDSLNDVKVRIPGYVVPLDFSAASKHTEFLLVPYFGACLHTPPPPPNQIIFVKANPAVEITNIYDPFWIEGVMKTGEFNSNLGDSAYEVDLTLIKPYEY